MKYLLYPLPSQKLFTALIYIPCLCLFGYLLLFVSCFILSSYLWCFLLYHTKWATRSLILKILWGFSTLSLGIIKASALLSFWNILLKDMFFIFNADVAKCKMGCVYQMASKVQIKIIKLSCLSYYGIAAISRMKCLHGHTVKSHSFRILYSFYIFATISISIKITVLICNTKTSNLLTFT